jgi:hypothetical protein
MEVVGKVWIVWRNAPNGGKAVWAVTDDEGTAHTLISRTMNPDEFEMFMMDVEHHTPKWENGKYQ